MCDSGISGRLDNLEAIVLSFPTSTDFSSMGSLNSSRYNDINSVIIDIRNKLSSLETYIVNLKMSHTSLERLVTGHTGLHLTGGAHSWVTGLG